MTTLENAIQKLKDREGYGDEELNIVALTQDEIAALINAASAVLHMAAAMEAAK